MGGHLGRLEASAKALLVQAGQHPQRIPLARPRRRQACTPRYVHLLQEPALSHHTLAGRVMLMEQYDQGYMTCGGST